MFIRASFRQSNHFHGDSISASVCLSVTLAQINTYSPSTRGFLSAVSMLLFAEFCTRKLSEPLLIRSLVIFTRGHCWIPSISAGIICVICTAPRRIVYLNSTVNSVIILNHNQLLGQYFNSTKLLFYKYSQLIANIISIFNLNIQRLRS